MRERREKKKKERGKKGEERRRKAEGEAERGTRKGKVRLGGTPSAARSDLDPRKGLSFLATVWECLTLI